MKTRLLVGTCRCGTTVRLDIGNKTKEEIIEKYTDPYPDHGFSCPGHHVELSTPYPYWWNLDEWEVQEGEVLSEEEFEAKLRETYKEVRDTEGMTGLITGFLAGYVQTNDNRVWNYVDSPKGKRWYYTNDDDMQGYLTLEDLPAFKKAYLEAEKQGEQKFEFKQMEFLTGYAKYVVEGMEDRLKGK